MLDSLPAVLRDCPQWIVWRKEWNEDRKKWDKRPLHAATGFRCDVTQQTSWSTYTQAVQTMHTYGESHALSGLGFVLGYNSGIVGIDFDNVFNSDGSIAIPRNHAMADRLNSYTEMSPSRTGLHVLTKAQFAGGRRFDGVEVYGQGRFFTMTGQDYGGRPIAERQYEVEQLVVEIDQRRANHAPGPLDWHAPERMGDAELFDMARLAENGDKFMALWEGKFEDFYPSQSEADFALVNMLGFYSDAPTQIVRLFHKSALGRRSKALRVEYVGNLIARSQDRRVPLVAIPAPETFIMSQPQRDTTPQIDDDDAEEAYAKNVDCFDIPEGFLKDLSEWFMAQSPYPMKELACVGALGLMAGIIGRQYQFKKGGLNLYLMLLAETGAGKDFLSMGVSRIFDAVCKTPPAHELPTGAGVDLGFPAARCFHGPSRLSGKGLLRALSEGSSLSMVSVAPEFSQTMSSMAMPNANEGLRDFQHSLLEFYTKSAEGSMYSGAMNADKAKDVKPISSPAFTLLCEGTPGRFYNSLNETMITDGLLSRFIIIERSGYEDEFFNAAFEQFAAVPEHIKHQVSEYCKQVFTLRQHGDIRIHVKMTADAEEYSERLRHYYRERGKKGTTEVHKFLWMRAHQNLCRMAALVAVGVSPYHPCVTATHLQWANRIIYRQVMLIVGKFKRGEVGKMETDESDQWAGVREIMDKWRRITPQLLKGQKSWPDAYAAGLLPYSYIQGRTSNMSAFRKDKRGASNALKTVLGSMEQAGALTRVRLDGQEGVFYRMHV